MRLGEPATIEPVARAPRALPDARASSSTRRTRGTTSSSSELAATGAVDSLDLKGHYRGTVVDVDADPGLYGSWPRASPTRGSRTPTSTPRPTRCSSRTATGSPGTRRSTRSRTSRRCPSRRGWSTSSRRASAACSAPARRLRLLRRARHRRVRRRPVRARPRPRADPVPRLAVPPRHAERRRAGRLQRPRAGGRPALQPARARARGDRLPLGRVVRALKPQCVASAPITSRHQACSASPSA